MFQPCFNHPYHFFWMLFLKNDGFYVSTQPAIKFPSISHSSQDFHGGFQVAAKRIGVLESGGPGDGNGERCPKR
jgi:hypothetical protein